ncbi:uncharacterized protein [Oryza sativa Japonica Group]|uniref:Lipase, putative, expressed n=3 Tax=Oryza TaxID=4527 RepID=Q2QN32_ORYSJ|nr:uncharacterized protein LOC4352639 [Oryza sativa Japonica Group]ABA99131.1 Lipase, putative, expressed [Oryza sativa Japonica Group]EAY83663.1 hypothetical protein OsI_38888 [Oryza sativa Indica Group]KAF2908517.1 hypothetical protein DAI22_12g189900 [Oryza sativa Japonica Group]
MDKKQGFFSALREEVARGLSPARARRRSQAAAAAEVAAALRYAGGGGGGEMLAPLMEGPDPESGDGGRSSSSAAAARREGWGRWVRGQLSRAPSTAGAAVVAAGGGGGAARRNDLRLLLGVMGAPLAPVHVAAGEPLPHLSIKDTPIETSSAQYILQQYLAASGGQKLLSSVRNSYAMGKVRMVATEFETGGRVVRNRMAARATESGRFVLWQMAPEMWYIELAVGGSKVHAGCNGKLVWRHTPWLGAHSAKGPVRPLRRALQGLDPLTAASMFAGARCIGERKVNGEDCFILKLCADPETLRARSEGLAEIIRHVLFGYFSQKTGLLVHLEDSHLTRIQSTTGGDAVYWETTINSFIEDYRPVEGIMVAHAGRSAVTLFRFGEVAMSHTKTRMEEAWSIEEVAFNVPGLSIDCFIPPTDIKSGSISETVELPHGEKSKVGLLQCHSAKVAALEKADDNVAWSGALQRDFK